MTQNYGDSDYWDDRYKKDKDPFDWYQSFETLKPFLDDHVLLNDNILMLGCGNSKLSEEMYDNGYKTITNIDISGIVIDQCKEKYPIEMYPGLIYQVGDALDMEDFEDETFDIVLDKGTFDTIMCGDDIGNAILMCEEVFRVLKKDGIYIVISYGKDREFYFDQASDWEIEIQQIPKPEDYQDKPNKINYHYIYIMRKNQ